MSKYLELVESSFTQEHFDKQAVENKPYVAYSVKDKGVIYTIIPIELKYTILYAVKTDMPHRQYDLVDLGLSVKWATCNIGAETPTDLGAYFEWGHKDAVLLQGYKTITRSELIDLANAAGLSVTDETLDQTLELYKQLLHLDILKQGLILNHEFTSESWNEASNKYPNNGDLLNAGDDAASFYSDGQLRMPTKAELEELLTLQRVYVDVDGNYLENPSDVTRLIGVELRSTNGNKLYLPYNNYVMSFMVLQDMYGGMLWSSEKYFESDSTEYAAGAWLLSFSSDDFKLNILGPSVGAGIRGVSELI